MIGARLGPSLTQQVATPAPDPGRTPRRGTDDTGTGFDAGDRKGSPERADRPAHSRQERSERPGQSERDRTRQAERGERAGRSGHADRRERAGRPERDENADSFERMLDRDGPRPLDAARADTSETSTAPDAQAAGPTSDTAAAATPQPVREALPAQLLALLSTLAPAGTPPAGASVDAAAATGMPAAGGAAALPTLTAPPPATTPGAGLAAPGATLAAAPATTAQAVTANAIDTASVLAALAPESADAGATTDTLASLERSSESTPFALPATASSSSIQRAAAVPTLATVALPADPQAGFDDGFGSRIVWMAEQRLGHADIRITPEHLGTIDVRLQLDGAKVSAEFYSTQPEVRQALEASFGRLRELLGEQGLQLAHADVGQQRSGQGGDGASNADPARPEPESAQPAPAVIRSRRLLDEVA